MLARLARALCLAALVAGPASAAELTRLPARVEGHDVYLQVRLNGGAPVWMKFDVGAGRSSLASAGMAAKNKPCGPAPLGVSLGDVALAPVRFVTNTVPAASGPDGAPLAGHLGEDSLGDRVLVIKYAKGEVYISPPIDTSRVPLPPLAHARTASR
jgi:hypothetical protein